MKTALNISTDNYYFVQAFGKETDKHRVMRTVCFADNIDQAKTAIKKWKDENNLRDEYIYHKNYKRDSRAMVEVGNYIVA